MALMMVPETVILPATGSQVEIVNPAPSANIAIIVVIVTNSRGTTVMT